MTPGHLKAGCSDRTAVQRSAHTLSCQPPGCWSLTAGGQQLSDGLPEEQLQQCSPSVSLLPAAVSQ